ncbi:uncharacterized protein LOC114242379 [Bombyx mandarina]|uniref:Uncharacterized protein LOC114242379 n=1 Tax=Bombyx mandarina TaxID=7092 RepID=A0A6J2JIC2_BOMMA|nr:uncharacterized protein LOC114242379 [Bombyx mandarina]
MQDYGAGVSSNNADIRESSEGKDRTSQQSESFQTHHSITYQNHYGVFDKDLSDQNIATYCRVAAGIYEATSLNQQYQNSRNSTVPTFSSPPNSPLVGLVFDPSSHSYHGSGIMGDRGANLDRRSQSTWSINSLEPIGTGAKKKIIKSQDKRNAYSADPRYHDRGKDEYDRQRSLRAESSSSLDFYVEGERMVSELCNIPDCKTEKTGQLKNNHKGSNLDEDKIKSASSELLLTALDKIVVHDQIPNQIVQLAIEACTDAENIAIAHHNRPCFKNIHSICAKTRSNVQKPDSAVANLHSQGIPWVIKNFIFSFVRILDGWKGVKELLSEKHDTFSRIENKYYSPNIRECFVQWQAVTKEMLTHIYKTFKCLDHGFTMEQKSFAHNYYATNSAAPRHQAQSKYQPPKPQISTPRPINVSPQPFSTVQPPWIQGQSQTSNQSFNEVPWGRPGVSYKKFPVVPPSTFYPLNDQSDIEVYQKVSYKCDPCSIREAKPRQSWTIANTPDFRSFENVCHTDQRDLYNQLKHKIDAELVKAPGQPVMSSSMVCDLLQRREMEMKAKMIPLSHVEKTLIPSMASAVDPRTCFVHKNNSCGDTKEENDFFATWGQITQKETNDYMAHHTHNVQNSPSVLTVSSNVSGPVNFLDENDEFHEMAKVYMKPGSYKVPIKPADAFASSSSQDAGNEGQVLDELNTMQIKASFSTITLAPQPKYNLESWPCIMTRRTEEVYSEDQKVIGKPLHTTTCLDVSSTNQVDLLSSMTSDRAWEAAKQSAPKLMDFLHEDSKSDTARLYDALGLCTNDDYTDLTQTKAGIEETDEWTGTMPSNTSFWNQNNRNDHCVKSTNDSVSLEEATKNQDTEIRAKDANDTIEVSDSNEPKEPPRCPSFDQSGNCIRDETHKKSTGKLKVGASGMWYHPKKKKPLSSGIVKKFENLLANLSKVNEAAFIQQDMDIKMAPRFYEIVKYPMCLHDISTKLKNSSYTDHEQVVQDFRRIFNNVRLYLKSHPDAAMKKNVNKVSNEFEKMLNDEFPNKRDGKSQADNTMQHKKHEKEETIKCDDTNKRGDMKTPADEKK